MTCPCAFEGLADAEMVAMVVVKEGGDGGGVILGVGEEGLVEVVATTAVDVWGGRGTEGEEAGAEMFGGF